MEGWIKLHRKLLDWEWHDDPNTLSLFIHLLLKANHKGKRWRGQLVESGQVITGRRSLSKATGLSEQSVRTSLEKLKSTREVTIKSTNRFSIITIVKWGDYQAKKSESTSKSTSQTPTSNQQVTTNKNDKNDKKKRKGGLKFSWKQKELEKTSSLLKWNDLKKKARKESK